MPQSGKSKGLVLVLDAHTDKVTGSSISSDFEVNINIIKTEFYDFKGSITGF